MRHLTPSEALRVLYMTSKVNVVNKMKKYRLEKHKKRFDSNKELIYWCDLSLSVGNTRQCSAIKESVDRLDTNIR